MTFESTPGSTWTEQDWAIEVERQKARAERTEAVVRALAAADPVYDYMCCFFCKALAPIPPVNRGPAWTEDCEDHDADCPWWMARQILGRPAWPVVA